MKKLSKLSLTSKVEILNENEMKHLKGGYGGLPPSGNCTGDPYEACENLSIGKVCCWFNGGQDVNGVCYGSVFSPLTVRCQ